MNKPRITATQFVLLIVGSRLLFAYTYMPVLEMPPRNQDAWIVMLLSGPYSVVLSLPALYLVAKFRGYEIDVIMQTILGKITGKVFLVLLALFAFFCVGACPLVAVTFINTYLYPHVPSWIIYLFLFVPVCYAAWHGAGSLARLALFIVPYIIITVVLFMILSFNQLDFKILSPILADSSLLDLNLGGFYAASFFSEILAILVMSAYLEPKTNVNRAFGVSIVVFVIAVMVMIVPTLTMLGLDVARHSWNPYYVFTRQVEAYEFIQRVESLNVIAWFLGVMLKVSLFAYLCGHLLSKVVGTKSHKWFIVPIILVAFITITRPIINRTFVTDVMRSYTFEIPIIIFSVVVLPAIAVIVYWIRRKKIQAPQPRSSGASSD